MATGTVQIIEDVEQMKEVEALQRLVWPGSETDVVPVHVLRSAVQHGGLLMGAWMEQQLIGFVFGFPGTYSTPDGPRLEHYSHMLAVHPDFRGQGVGYSLKRAQWQMVRHQGIDRITWTYDPLLSRNAWLNITRLGAVCNTYHRDFYGSMRDGLNQGLASDRFQVDWWGNTQRVNHKLSRRSRPPLELDHYLTGEVPIITPAQFSSDGWLVPGMWQDELPDQPTSLLLIEIPVDFIALKAAEPDLAVIWRMQIRKIFETLFYQGYLVTDFVRGSDDPKRSYYVVCHGESTL